MKRTVLITGAAGGIGSAAVERFHLEGWRVIGIDRVAWTGDPGIGDHHVVDLSEAGELTRFFQGLDPDEFHLDCLVNNAAVQPCKSLLDTTLEEWDEAMAVNVRAAFLSVKGAVPFMHGAESSIVNVASVHAVATSAGIAAYAASKGALLALTRALALELAPRIRVNAVLPGAVETAMLRAGFERGGEGADARREALESRTPAGRVGRPEEIAEAIYFLADYRRSSFVTGQTLIADGGATARLGTE